MANEVVVICRCRTCDRRARLVLHVNESGLVPVTYDNGTTRDLSPEEAVSHFVWCAGSFIQYARRGGVFVDGSRSCRVPHGPMRGKKLKAKRTDKPCDGRCMRSASGECHCSCGGANHGIYA